jgi:hypothetical protein
MDGNINTTRLTEPKKTRLINRKDNQFKGLQDAHYFIDNKLVVFKRGLKRDVWYARYKIEGEKRYKWESLKTLDFNAAQEAAHIRYLAC